MKTKKFLIKSAIRTLSKILFAVIFLVNGILAKDRPFLAESHILPNAKNKTLANVSGSGIATGNFDNDARDEMVFSMIDGRGELAILVYDYHNGNHMNRIGDRRFGGASDVSIAIGNFDNDPQDEMVFSMIDGRGELAILIYDFNNSNSLHRIGDIRLAGASNASVATGNFDQDLQDEMVFTMIDGGEELAILVYDFNNSNSLHRIGDIRLAGATDASVATGNFDHDSQDEMVFSMIDGRGELAILVYDFNNSNSLNRIGDRRLAGATDASVATGNFDHDHQDEMVFTMIDGRGELAILVYDYNNISTLNRIGDRRLAGATDATVATGNFDHDTQDEMVFSMIDGRGELAILVYDYNNSNNLNRIGDRRLSGASNASGATANFDNDAKDEIVFSMIDGRGQLAVLVYDYNNSNNLIRIGDLRLNTLPAYQKVKLELNENQLFVGSFVKIPIIIDATSGLGIDDLTFDIPAGNAGGSLSFSPEKRDTLDKPYIMLLAGYKPGQYQLQVKERSSGILLDSAVYTISNFWPDDKQGPSRWISGDFILPGVSGAAWGGGNATEPENYNVKPAKGKKQVAILLVDTKSQRFSAAETSVLPGRWDTIAFKGFLKDGKKVSVAHYYKEISLDNLQFEGQVFGPVQLPGEWNDYLKDDGKYKANLWQACASAGDDLIDFSKFQHLVCVIRSVDASGSKPRKRVHPHADKIVAKVKEGDIPIATSNMPANGNIFGLTATLCHELGHNLGLGDIYPWSGHPKQMRDRTPGVWSLMAYQGNLPHMLLVHKMMLGWIPKNTLKLFNFQKTSGFVDETVYLEPVELANNSPGTYSGIEIRLAPGRDYYFEYRVGQGNQIGDQNLPSKNKSIGSILGTDVHFSEGFEHLNRRKPVMLLEKDADGDGPILALRQNYKEQDISDPIPTDFVATVTKIDGKKAALRIRYGATSQPDPSIRPWNLSNYQSPDIEVFNKRNKVDPKWKNVPWEGHQNTIVAKVTNKGNLNAPKVWVDFYVKDYTVNSNNAQPIKIGQDVQDIPPLQTREFKTVWMPGKQGHYCIVAKIRHYQTPGANTVIETTELNNRAQSNYARFISAKASPPSREATSIKVQNPFSKPTRVNLHLAKSTSPLFRTYLEHSWVLLKPGETRDVKVMFEYIFEDDPTWITALEAYLSKPNNVSVIGEIEFPDDDLEAYSVPLGGVSAQVITGIATEIENFYFDPPFYCGGQVVRKGTRAPVSDGKIILIMRKGETETYLETQVDAVGQFQAELTSNDWESIQAYYIGADVFTDSESILLRR